MRSIVAVDDHGGLSAGILRTQLTNAGYPTTTVPALIDAAHTDAAIVVAWLREPDAAAVVANIRAKLRRPLLVITPGNETEFLTVLDLYEAGADDCMTDPLDVDRLVAGIDKLLEGKTAATAIETMQPPAVTSPLLPIEKRILAGLIEHSSRPLTRRQLAEQVWGPRRSDQESILRVFLHLIGRKLAEPERLVTNPQVRFQ